MLFVLIRGTCRHSVQRTCQASGQSAALSLSQVRTEPHPLKEAVGRSWLKPTSLGPWPVSAECLTTECNHFAVCSHVPSCSIIQRFPWIRIHSIFFAWWLHWLEGVCSLRCDDVRECFWKEQLTTFREAWCLIRQYLIKRHFIKWRSVRMTLYRVTFSQKDTLSSDVQSKWHFIEWRSVKKTLYRVTFSQNDTLWNDNWRHGYWCSVYQVLYSSSDIWPSVMAIKRQFSHLSFDQMLFQSGVGHPHWIDAVSWLTWKSGSMTSGHWTSDCLSVAEMSMLVYFILL